jgi:hypothetical protein
MTSELERWMREASRGLSRESAGRVRVEIQEHYDAALESATDGGAATHEAERLAMTTLGDAAKVNCQYRKVMLTRSEARMMREAAWETRAMCSRAWMKWVLLAATIGALAASAFSFARGAGDTARILLAMALLTGHILAAMVLRINTPLRGRIYRGVRWAVLIAVMALAMGRMTPQESWLPLSCLWVVAWIEVTRNSMRRKLPVSQWPKQLYL